MNPTVTPSVSSCRTAFYEAGRTAAACCLGIRFQRASISPNRERAGTVDDDNLAVTEALLEFPIGRQEVIDRYVRSLLVGAIMSQRVTGRTGNALSFLSEEDRDAIASRLRRRGGIVGEAARQRHLAKLRREAASLANRKDFQGVVEEIAAELLSHGEFAYYDILQVLIRHAVQHGI